MEAGRRDRVVIHRSLHLSIHPSIHPFIVVDVRQFFSGFGVTRRKNRKELVGRFELAVRRGAAVAVRKTNFI